MNFEDLIRLRAAVGLLGEAGQAAWWQSSWFSSSAPKFLSPIFGERRMQAQVDGVVESARRVHDERIGIGRVFHLFRLPETIERRLHDALREETFADALSQVTSSHIEARKVLSELAGGGVDAAAGPIRVGPLVDLEGSAWVPAVAAHYASAFDGGIETFPYFADR